MAGDAPPRAAVLRSDVPGLLRALRPNSRSGRRLLVGSGIVVFVALSVGTMTPFLIGSLTARSLWALSYLGIFLLNFLSTAVWFIPMPPLVGQAAIVAGSHTLWQPGVVLAGSLGMILADSTSYLAGVLGRGIAADERFRVQGRFGSVLRRIGAPVERVMRRRGFLTVLVLSAVPNPLFDIAGIAAGALYINFWIFLIAAGIGKTARAVALVVVGSMAINLFIR
jgi:membrane protein DedA with SNARE-associated domain